MADKTRNEQMTITNSVSVVSTPVQDGRRRLICLRNSSTGGQIISFAFSDTSVAVANSGIVLSQGQSSVDATSEGYICWQGNITAIASAAGAILSIYERVA